MYEQDTFIVQVPTWRPHLVDILNLLLWVKRTDNITYENM